MNIGLYQSAASLSALERWQDAVSQNITSGQVSGYRKRTVEFSAQTGGQWQLDSAATGGRDTTVPAVFPKATATGSISRAATRSRPDATWIWPSRARASSTSSRPTARYAYTRNGQFSVRGRPDDRQHGRRRR